MAIFTIATGTTTFNGVTEGVNPGDTIRVQNSAGRDYLTISDVAGSAVSPVRIVNWQGRVVINALPNTRTICLVFDNCEHIIVDGWGDDSAWGFKLIGFTNCGLHLTNQTEYATVFGIEITDDDPSDGGAGIRAGTRLTDASPGFVVHDFEIHDCYIHDIYQEAMYIGHSSITSQYPIDGLIVQYNRCLSCGWAGIQIRSATDVDCFRNEMVDCGSEVDAGHAGGGLNIGVNTTDPMSGEWHYNTIRDCERGIHGLTGDVDIDIHHILIEDCGLTGAINDPQGGLKFQNAVEANFKIRQLTVIDNDAGGSLYGVKSKTADTAGEFENCIIAGTMTTRYDSSWTDDNNEKTTVAAQNFRGDVWYHLTGGSPDSTTGWMPWV